MKKFLAMLLVVGFMAFAQVVHAEIKPYTGTGEYVMSDRETQEIAKQGAKMHALRAAQEQAGVFISSHSVMKDFELEKDEVTAFTAGILNVGEVSYKVVPLNDAGGYVKFIATVTVTIDTNELQSKIDAWFKRNADSREELISQNRELQNIIDAQAKRIAELEKSAAVAKTPQEKAKVDEGLAELDKMTLYAQKLKEINSTLLKSDKDSANKYINLCNEALKLNPNGAEAYYNRGRAYSILVGLSKGNEKKEYLRLKLNDFDKAIQLDPNNYAYYKSRAYYYYYDCNNFQKSVEDYGRAIQVASDPKILRGLYEARAMIFMNDLKDYKSAIADLSKSIELGETYPKLFKGWVYWGLPHRGECYMKLKDYRKAIEDFSKYLEIRKGNRRQAMLAIFTSLEANVMRHWVKLPKHRLTLQRLKV